MLNYDVTVTCEDQSMAGITIKGCGWTGKHYELVEKYHNSISHLHPLSGRESYTYHCPKCGLMIDEMVIRQS